MVVTDRGRLNERVFGPSLPPIPPGPGPLVSPPQPSGGGERASAQGGTGSSSGEADGGGGERQGHVAGTPSRGGGAGSEASSGSTTSQGRPARGAGATGGTPVGPAVHLASGTALPVEAPPPDVGEQAYRQRLASSARLTNSTHDGAALEAMHTAWRDLRVDTGTRGAARPEATESQPRSHSSSSTPRDRGSLGRGEGASRQAATSEGTRTARQGGLPTEAPTSAGQAEARSGSGDVARTASTAGTDAGTTARHARAGGGTTLQGPTIQGQAGHGTRGGPALSTPHSPQAEARAGSGDVTQGTANAGIDAATTARQARAGAGTGLQGPALQGQSTQANRGAAGLSS